MKYFLPILICAVNGCTTVGKKTIRATGRAAEATLKAGRQATKKAATTTIDMAAAAFKKSVVTVIDSSTGASRKVPWEEGLRISKIQTVGQAVEIVRDTQTIKATADAVLHAGDVIRIQSP